jgi:predicted XRE-type DNA-binding protein
MLEIEEGSGNVYRDLNMADAKTMYVKAQLANKISDIIRRRRLTQQQAALVLDIPQPALSSMLRGRFRDISEANMLEFLNRLGQDVDIVIRKAPRNHPLGQTQVLFSHL